ncbi:MAG: aminotransferase class V-fold PLP-dependent enzyme [Actinomycetota bacterium]|nr:aminotransferase class V-fold PLP-dependent enzyme [Actinomycetota bacterium]
MRSAFGERFEVPSGYLNTASIGVPPSRAVEAVDRAVQRWRTAENTAPEFDEPVAVARRAWARMARVDPNTVASGTSVSQLVALVASGVPDGTKVLVADGDFTSLSFPFAAQAHRGVTVTEVAQAELGHRAAEFDLVAVSVVQSADGTIADLDALRESGARVLLDATQSIGWLPVELGWADWVVGSSYKWLLGPRGCAWLAISAAARSSTLPVAANWYAGENPWDTIYGLPLRLAGDARAFDLSPVWLSQVGAAASMPWLAGLDRAEVHAHCVGLADGLLAGLGLPSRGSAIVSIGLPDAADRLEAAGIRCAVRAGRPRLSFHLYNTQDDVDRALAALRDRHPG